jgi:hypothetical protein
MQISQIRLPQASVIEKKKIQIDYSDSFQCRFYSHQQVSLESCVRYIFNNWPNWMSFLIWLRNILVKPFGLDSSNDVYEKGAIPVINISKGGKVIFFEVVECNDEEVLLFFSDKHLDGYLSCILKNFNLSYEVILTTVVKYNNNLGRVYLFCIKPFHKLIIRSMLHRLANHFTQNN